MSNDRFPRTVVRCVELEAKLAYSTSTHKVYYCPYCYDKEVKYDVPDPKPDTSGKLFINERKNQGYCQRCSTIVFTNWTIESSFDRLVEAFTDDLKEDLNLNSLPDINVEGFTPAHTSEEAVKYLSSRNPSFNQKSIERLNLKWIDMWTPILDGVTKEWMKVRRQGVLTPLKYKGRVKSYQIRYLTDDKKRRFHTMDGIKILSTINSIPTLSEVSICEGYYDAVALLCMGFPNPIALLGKIPSALQISQLRELLPVRVNYCLDDRALNSGLHSLLKKHLKCLAKSKFWDFGGRDPEEFYVKNLKFRYTPWIKNY